MADSNLTRPSPIVSVNDTFDTLTLTSTAWVDVGTWNTRFLKTKGFYLTGATTSINAVYQVLASGDGGDNYSITAVSSASLGAASTHFFVTDYYTNLKLQARLASATTTDTVTIAAKYWGANL